MLAPMEKPGREARRPFEWIAIAVALLAFLAMAWDFGRWGLGLW